MSKDQVLAELGIPATDWPAYRNMGVRSLDPSMYAQYLGQARQGDGNIYEHIGYDGRSRFFYVSGVETGRASHSRIQVDGTAYASDASFLAIDPATPAGQKITASYATLAAPIADTGWVPGTRLRAVDRGQGQAAAMNKWNALGAAAYANRFLGQHFDLSHNWEWLHVQGAQIGGQTVGGNL